MKYRIKEELIAPKVARYFIQVRFLFFFWVTLDNKVFETMEECEEEINFRILKAKKQHIQYHEVE